MFRKLAITVVAMLTLSSLIARAAVATGSISNERTCRQIFSGKTKVRDFISDLMTGGWSEPRIDRFWDPNSRYNDDALENLANETIVKQSRRTWFFPKGKIGDETAQFLDIPALGFAPENTQFHTRHRVIRWLRAPILDVQEIRQRQGALKEMMIDRPELLTRLDQILNKKETDQWLYDSFEGNSGWLEETTAQILRRGDEEYRVHKDIKSKGSSSLLQDGWTREFLQARIESRKQFFRDVQEVLKAFRETGLQSQRLKQMESVMTSILEDRRSDGSGTWIQNLLQTSDILKHEELMSQITPISSVEEWKDLKDRKSRRIHLLVEMFSEFTMYFELAKHAKAMKWNSFPEVLNPDSLQGPVLLIEEGHAPRVLFDAAYRGGSTSIPNSVRLGIDGKRHAIVTGPVTHGKSTFMRMAGQLLTLAQMGLPVPAKSMSFTPMSLIVYLHPHDQPTRGDSGFKAESRELWQGVFWKAQQNPYQLVLMDEIAPGITQKVREDYETVFLETLDRTGVLSVTATHNLGTTQLGENSSGHFLNMYASNHQVIPGATSDLTPMYEAAATALHEVGAPEGFIQQFLERGRSRLK